MKEKRASRKLILLILRTYKRHLEYHKKQLSGICAQNFQSLKRVLKEEISLLTVNKIWIILTTYSTSKKSVLPDIYHRFIDAYICC